MSKDHAVAKKDTPAEPDQIAIPGWKTLEQIRGGENLRRGLGKGGMYTEAAIQFIKDFPIGSPPFSAERFDGWASQHGYLEVPPPGTPRNSKEWKAHCQDRHYLKYNMVKASAHSRMRAKNAPAFAIELGGSGTWQVVAPEDAFLHDKFGRAVHRLYRRKGQKYAYLLQSADWAELEKKPKLSAMIQSYYYSLRGSQRRLATEIQILLEEGDRIEQEVRRAVEAGDIKLQNGGIQNMLRDENLEDVDADSEALGDEEPLA